MGQGCIGELSPATNGVIKWKKCWDSGLGRRLGFGNSVSLDWLTHFAYHTRRLTWLSAHNSSHSQLSFILKLTFTMFSASQASTCQPWRFLSCCVPVAIGVIAPKPIQMKKQKHSVADKGETPEADLVLLLHLHKAPAAMYWLASASGLG